MLFLIFPIIFFLNKLKSNKIIIISGGSNIVRKVTARQPIPKDVLVELTPRHNKECMFCGHKDISEKKYGPLYQLNDVIVHYFCIVSMIYKIL